jgi:hypothetical protein
MFEYFHLTCRGAVLLRPLCVICKTNGCSKIAPLNSKDWKMFRPFSQALEQP